MRKLTFEQALTYQLLSRLASFEKSLRSKSESRGREMNRDLNILVHLDGACLKAQLKVEDRPK